MFLIRFVQSLLTALLIHYCRVCIAKAFLLFTAQSTHLMLFVPTSNGRVWSASQERVASQHHQQPEPLSEEYGVFSRSIFLIQTRWCSLYFSLSSLLPLLFPEIYPGVFNQITHPSISVLADAMLMCVLMPFSLLFRLICFFFPVRK
ncbi:hypothetical protein BDV12DRAFT_72833 [Aspergillus spectabilis]